MIKCDINFFYELQMSRVEEMLGLLVVLKIYGTYLMGKRL
jgi:hypothetical protein